MGVGFEGLITESRSDVSEGSDHGVGVGALVGLIGQAGIEECHDRTLGRGGQSGSEERHGVCVSLGEAFGREVGAAQPGADDELVVDRGERVDVGGGGLGIAQEALGGHVGE